MRRGTRHRAQGSRKVAKVVKIVENVEVVEVFQIVDGKR
jgi:hypothetical protein